MSDEIKSPSPLSSKLGDESVKVAQDQMLADEAEAINKQIAEEEAKADGAAEKNAKGEEAGSAEDKVSKEEKPQDKKGEEDVRTPIPDDLRKRIGIPDKFKDMESYARWAIEAEKAKSAAENEKGKLLMELRKKELEIERIKGESEGALKTYKQQLQEKVDAGTISPAKRDELIAKFREDWDTDAPAVMDRILAAQEERIFKRLEDQRKKDEEERSKARVEEEKRAQNERYESEFKDLKSRYDEQTFMGKVLPKLQEIADKRPYLQSLKEVYLIYKEEQAELETQIKADADAKRNEKKSSAVEAGGSATKKSEVSLEERIKNAKTIEELDALGKLIKEQ